MQRVVDTQVQVDEKMFDERRKSQLLAPPMVAAWGQVDEKISDEGKNVAE